MPKNTARAVSHALARGEKRNAKCEMQMQNAKERSVASTSFTSSFALSILHFAFIGQVAERLRHFRCAAAQILFAGPSVTIVTAERSCLRATASTSSFVTASILVDLLGQRDVLAAVDPVEPDGRQAAHRQLALSVAEDAILFLAAVISESGGPESRKRRNSVARRMPRHLRGLVGIGRERRGGTHQRRPAGRSPLWPHRPGPSSTNA